MAEPRETKIKRLKMRSMRRGIKEMDLILEAFARAELNSMSDAGLALYDQLIAENDHDLYSWIGGQVPVPAPYQELIAQISAEAQGVTRPQ